MSHSDSNQKSNATFLPLLSLTLNGSNSTNSASIISFLTFSVPSGASAMARWVKNPPANQEAQETRRLDPWLEKIPWRRKMAPHSGVLAWRTPWTEEPAGSEESQRAGLDSVTMHVLGTSSPLPQGPSINSLHANFWKASLSQDTAIFWKIAILYLFFSKQEASSPVCWKATIVNIEDYDVHAVNGSHSQHTQWLGYAEPAESWVAALSQAITLWWPGKTARAVRPPSSLALLPQSFSQNMFWGLFWAFLVVHGPVHRMDCGTWAELPCGMWDLSFLNKDRTPALYGGFFTTGPPGKSLTEHPEWSF